MNRTSRIITLLVIDVVFFFVELIVGMSTPTFISVCPHWFNGMFLGVPNSQDMLLVHWLWWQTASTCWSTPTRIPPGVVGWLNPQFIFSDVLSLIVALYAIKVCHPFPSYFPHYSPWPMHVPTSWPTRLMSTPVTLTDGIVQKSLRLSLTVYSCLHYVSPSSWKP